MGQTKPLETYSSNKFWNSIPAKDGKGFKFTSTINVKDNYLFIFYKDHIIIKSKGNLYLKIQHVNKINQDVISYSLVDNKDVHFIAELSKGLIDKKQYYYINFYKVDRKGKPLTLTKFDCKRI